VDILKTLESVMDVIKEGVFIIDKNFDFVYANKAINTIGLDYKSLVGKSAFEVFPNLKEENSTFVQVFETKKPIINREQNFITYRGERRTTLTSTYPLIVNGVLIGAFETFQDISALQKLSSQIHELQLSKKIKSNRKTNEMIENDVFRDFIGEDPKILKIKSKINMLANSPSPTFIYGETGTGKEVLVEAIHKANKNKVPLITQNCAAIPESLMESYLFGTSKGSYTGAIEKAGLFEIADGGILFLDEINSLPKELQAKLLRVIQEQKVRRVGATDELSVNVRIIVASNIHPEELLRNNEIREDLFFRLNVIYLELPPLSERKSDIPLFTEYFINEFNNLFNKNISGITAAAIKKLKEYSWPGNIRELKNTIERIMNEINSGFIQENDIELHENFLLSSNNYKNNIVSNHSEQHRTFKDRIQKTEIKIIKNELRKTKGNISQAARNLDMPQQTLSSKIKLYSLQEFIYKIKLLEFR